jgi:hypothetical protein
MLLKNSISQPQRIAGLVQGNGTRSPTEKTSQAPTAVAAEQIKTFSHLLLFTRMRSPNRIIITTKVEIRKPALEIRKT